MKRATSRSPPAVRRRLPSRWPAASRTKGFGEGGQNGPRLKKARAVSISQSFVARRTSRNAPSSPDPIGIRLHGTGHIPPHRGALREGRTVEFLEHRERPLEVRQRLGVLVLC